MSSVVDHEKQKVSFAGRLYALGFDEGVIAHILSKTLDEVKKDLEPGRAQLLSTRPRDRSEMFQRVLQSWFKLLASRSEHSDELGTIFAYLSKWLQIDQLELLARHIERVTEPLTRPHVTSSQQGYLLLLDKIHGTDSYTPARTLQGHLFAWKYLSEIEPLVRAHTGPASYLFPDSHERLLDSFVEWYSEGMRNKIAPTWPNDGSIEKLIEAEIDKLAEDQAILIRAKYTAYTLSDEPIDLILNRTPDECRDLEKQALLCLRQLAKHGPLGQIVQPLNDAWKKVLGCLTPVENDSLVNALLLSVENFGFSTRTRCALWNSSIFLIGQLVQRNGNDLLKIRNFGRKSLQEVRRVLGDAGLRLEMKVGAIQQQAINEELKKFPELSPIV